MKTIAKFAISNFTNNPTKRKFTIVDYEINDKKVVIENFIGYRITIEKIKQCNCTECELKRRSK